MEYLSILASTAVDLIMIFAPTSAYYFQYKLIRKTKSLGSFSIDICAVLIFASILRIFFRFGKAYQTALLYQAIIMLLVQIALLRECIKIKAIRLTTSPTKLNFSAGTGTGFEKIWRWDDFESYMKSVVIVAGALSITTFLFNKNQFYVETIGAASALVEACLGIPQFLSNWKNKSTRGLSMGMIGVWFAGDLGKTLYFVLNHSPIQFILCGSTQLIIDVSILIQIYMYAPKYQELGKGNKDNRKSSIETTNRKLITDPESGDEIVIDDTTQI